MRSPLSARLISHIFYQTALAADVPRAFRAMLVRERYISSADCRGFRLSGEKHRRFAVAKKDKSKKAKKLIKKARKMMKKAKKEMKKLKKKKKGSNDKVDRQDAPPTSPFSS
jgi:hypothetical protein